MYFVIFRLVYYMNALDDEWVHGTGEFKEVSGVWSLVEGGSVRLSHGQ